MGKRVVLRAGWSLGTEWAAVIVWLGWAVLQMKSWRQSVLEYEAYFDCECVISGQQVELGIEEILQCGSTRVAS